MVGSGNLMKIETFLHDDGTIRTPSTNNYAWYEPTGGMNGLPAFRVVAGGTTANGEVDGPYVSVKPGDHIKIHIWVKTSVFYSSDPQQGSFFGWDYYGNTDQGYGILYYDDVVQMGHPTGGQANYDEQAGDGPTGYGRTIDGASDQPCVPNTICRVAFGHPEWTQIVWEFWVPTRLCYYVYHDGKKACSGAPINSMVCWLGVNNTNGAPSEPVWFCDPYLEVNPDSTPPQSFSGEASVVLRYTDTSNFYYMGLGLWGHQYSISKYVGGVATELTSSGSAANLQNNIAYSLKGVVNGNTLQLWVNGVKVLEVQDSSLSSGLVGVGMNNSSVQVSNLSVNSV
jgi:hypothetical protein